MRHSKISEGIIALTLALMTSIHVLAGEPYGGSAEWARLGGSPETLNDVEYFVCSPNGMYAVKGDHSGLFLIKNGAVNIQLSVNPIWPLWEVVWAPNSQSFAVNYSDGGAVGTWSAKLFKLKWNGEVEEIEFSEEIRSRLRNFPKCYEKEEVNVAVVGWGRGGEELYAVGEVPPHSSCTNMGEVLGYRVFANSGHILEGLSEAKIRKRWAKHLGCRFGHCR